MLYNLFHNLHNFRSYFNNGFIYKVSRLFEITLLHTCAYSQVRIPATATDGVSWNKLIHIKPFSIRHFDLIISLQKEEAFVTFTRLIILILLWDFLPLLLNFSSSGCRLIALLLLLSSLQ